MAFHAEKATIANLGAPQNDCLHKISFEGLNIQSSPRNAQEPSKQDSGISGIAIRLRRCSNAKALSEGKQIHDHIIKIGLHRHKVLGNLLIQMYGSCGALNNARAVFDDMNEKNTYSWNILIAGYTRHGQLQEALELFRLMPEKDVVSWTTMLGAYVHEGKLEDALKLFYEMPQRNVVSWNAMISAYAQKGYLKEAIKLFEIMPWRNVVSWNSIIAAYAQQGMLNEANELFMQMPQRNVASWNTMITAYVQKCLIQEARTLFEQMPHRNVVSWTAMVVGYGQQGMLKEAKQLFQLMPHHDLVSWNAIISAYTEHGQTKEALELFVQMQATHVKPNSITFAAILEACARNGALIQGKNIHQQLLKAGFRSHIVVQNALVDMYAKCGCLETSRDVFNNVIRKDKVLWTVMIRAYCQHGCGKEALEIFQEMQMRGATPDIVTYSSIFSACSHSILIMEGFHYFTSMSQIHLISTNLEHCSCAANLVGRAGWLDEAEAIINSIPFVADTSPYITLLGLCIIHNDMDRGKIAAESAFELNIGNSSPYILLSNLYAAANGWNETVEG